MYFTMSGLYCGGTLFRTSDGEQFEMMAKWNQSLEYGDEGAYGLCVYNDELYLTLNHDGEDKYIRVLKSSDGGEFEEVWYSAEERMNAARLCVYEDRLYLYICGKSAYSVGTQIRYYHEGEFVLLYEGDPETEHTLLRDAVFNDTLYIGGGSGNWMSHDAIIHKIAMFIPPENNTGIIIEEPNIEIATEDLPFGTVFVLTKFNGHLYTAGRWNERVYRSLDGDNWVLAFPNATTYAWQNGITFNNSLYLISCEGSGDRRTTVLWRSSDGVSLDRIYEFENTTTARPALGIHNNMLLMGVETYIGENTTGCLYRSGEGEDWERIFTTNEGTRFQEFRIFNDAMYFTMSGLYCGGTLFRTSDGEQFEMMSKWNQSLEYGDEGAYGLCVYNDELYLTLNHDGEDKYIRVLKSSDGEEFQEVWYSTEERMNAARLCVYKDRLYLYICGKSAYSIGTQIRYYHEGEFVLLYEGDPETEHTLLRDAVFNDSLYIGGGSGNWMSHDAIIHKIVMIIPPVNNTEEPPVPDPREDREPLVVPDPLIIVAAGSLTALALIGLLTFHEPLRYLLISLFIPLYTRIRPKDMEESVAWAELLGYLRHHPGANYSTIKKDLEFSNGKLTHHLKMLEQAKRVRSLTNGAYRLFYPRDFPMPKDAFDISPMYSIQRKIIDVLTQNPGLKQNELVRILERDRKTVSIHLNTLVNRGKIRMERRGRENVYSVIESYGHQNPPPIIEDEVQY